MVAFLPLLAAGGAGLGAGLLSKKEGGLVNVDATRTTFSPTTSNVDSRQFTDARQLQQSFNYQPIVQIASPDAVANPVFESKKQASIDQEPVIRAQPRTDGSSATGINPLWLVGGGVAVAAIVVLGGKR